MAEDIAEDVGQVLTVEEGDPDRLIFVFEERHDSILGQIEIVIMLDRLYADYGMRHIGLEGLAAMEGPLDLSWAHWGPPYRPDQPITSREDVIAHTLFQGEIGSVEMMGLLYEDVFVDGIDDADLYAILSPEGVWSAPFNYLYNIAVAGMKKGEVSKWEVLREQEKGQEAFEYAISTDSFTQEAYDTLTDEIDIALAEERLEIYYFLQSRAKRKNVKLPPGTEENLRACIDHMTIVSERSDAMASNALDLASAHRGLPIAINVGFMHTERITELLGDAAVSYVVVRSQAHASGIAAGLLSSEAFQRKVEGLSVGSEGDIGAFLDGRKKYEVTSTKWWYETKVLIAEVLQWLLSEIAFALQYMELSPEDVIRYVAAIMDSKKELSAHGMTMKDLLKEHNIVSFKAEDWRGPLGEYNEFALEVRIVVRDPETGKETELIGEVAQNLKNPNKPQVTVRELFEDKIEDLREEATTEPSPEGTWQELTQAVEICSNASAVWKKGA